MMYDAVPHVRERQGVRAVGAYSEWRCEGTWDGDGSTDHQLNNWPTSNCGDRSRDDARLLMGRKERGIRTDQTTGVGPNLPFSSVACPDHVPIIRSILILHQRYAHFTPRIVISSTIAQPPHPAVAETRHDLPPILSNDPVDANP